MEKPTNINEQNETEVDKDIESLEDGVNTLPSISDVDQSSNSWETVDVDTVPSIETNKNEQDEDDWVDILGSGGLMKKVLVEGKNDNKPKRHMICTINYECKLTNGMFIEKMENLKIQVGDLEVVQAVDIALTLMNVGETCLIKVDPRLAYGAKGDPPNIPPNANLQYQIELLDVELEKEELSITERKKIGNEKKQRGNWWYTRGEYTFAIQCYRRAMDYLDDVEGGMTGGMGFTAPGDAPTIREETSDAELQDILEDRLSVHNNMAAAQMKQGAMEAALTSLQNVLRCQPNNVKALYRKSMILKEKNEIQEAYKCLQKAKSIEPENSSILKELKTINGIMQKHKNYEKELAKRMFSNNNTNEVDRVTEEKKSSPFLWASLVGSVAIGIAGIAAWRLKFS